MEDPVPFGPVGMDTIRRCHGGVAAANTLEEAQAFTRVRDPAILHPMPSPEGQSSQLSEGTIDQDELGGSIYGDQDDAQSFIQPAISPVATRLTSPKTPAAEKAAAMDLTPGGGLFDILDNPRDEPQTTNFSGDAAGPDPFPDFKPARTTQTGRNDTMTQTQTSQLPSLTPMPTSWRAGPKQLIISQPTTSKSSMSGVFGGQSRSHRSSSIGENALRRLSKALPSISIPTPSFFQSAQSQKDDPTRDAQKSASLVISPRPARAQYDFMSPASPRPSSRTSYRLRKSTSDDSLLYHSLSQVSSLGDDDRFVHIREQVNSRFKAIKDSWDGPSFKLPQFPNILAPPIKRLADPSSDGYWSGHPQTGQRGPRDSISPLDSVLESLTGDIVVMGGYRGSILRSSHPPYRQLWVPVKVGLNMRKVNMEVGLDPEDEETMEEHIFASGMLQNIGPVDISKRLFKKLRDCENARNGKLRVHDYGYDWRLSPHLLSRRLVSFLEKLPCNQPHVPKEKKGAWVIAHSLGGLITRHAVNQRPELFAGVVYAGTPNRCINILGPIRNGDAVLLNEKVLTAQVHFSLRTSFLFLPEDGFCFIDKDTKEEYPIDFYNVDDWVKYRLSPCVAEPALPPLSRSGTFSSLLGLTDSLSGLPLRSKSISQIKKAGHDTHNHNHGHKDRTLALQLGTSSAANNNTITSSSSITSSPNSSNQSSPRRQTFPQHTTTTTSTSSSPTIPSSSYNPSPTTTTTTTSPTTRERNISYLRRTLSQTKQFRAELAHLAHHQSANSYPPLAVIYAKDIPTVHAARVSNGREGIPCADAYDDLVFRSGDGVVLAREAMVPEGYGVVREGRVCTDRGHVTLLGDLNAVGRALGAVVRGRGKGIGMGGGGGGGVIVGR